VLEFLDSHLKQAISAANESQTQLKETKAMIVTGLESKWMQCVRESVVFDGGCFWARLEI